MDGLLLFLNMENMFSYFGHKNVYNFPLYFYFTYRVQTTEKIKVWKITLDTYITRKSPFQVQFWP